MLRLAAFVAVAAPLACSSSDDAMSSLTAVDAPSRLPSFADAGTVSETTADAPLGELAVVDEPDTPCRAPGGKQTVLYRAPKVAGPSATPVIERLALAGSRRIAGDVDGFVLFDRDGHRSTDTKISIGTYATAFASEGQTFGAVGSSYDLVSYQRFDPEGEAIGPRLTLATGTVRPPGLTLAGGGGNALALWSDGRLYAAGVTDGTSPVTFALGAPYTTFLSAAAAFDGREFGVIWSALRTPVDAETWFARVSTTGVTSAPVRVTTSLVVHRAVKMTATPTGFAVAFDTGPGGVHVLGLDAQGRATGAAHRIVGASFAWDLVARGSELGLLANGAKKDPRFRPLSASGAPAGDWVCFSEDPCDDAALDVDDDGYAAVYRTYPSFDDVLARFDRLGQ